MRYLVSLLAILGLNGCTSWMNEVPVKESIVVDKSNNFEKSYRVGESFKDCAECPEMVVVPAGKFDMGSIYGESNEKPVHKVTINYQFAVGKYEITFAEWDACVAGGGCGGYRPDDRAWGRGKRPVIGVSWGDAKRYISWLSQKTGKSYRLLSESEWEYTARGSSSTAYPWGDDVGKNKANCYGCENKLNRGETSPVGMFRANSFGLYDVIGNVWEWVEDCYQHDYVDAPTDGGPRKNCMDNNVDKWVLRSGSWANYPNDTRLAHRFGWVDNRLNDFGFRIARSL